MEFRFVEDRAEGGDGEVEVAVFLHVEIDEFGEGGGGSEEEAETIGDDGQGVVPCDETDLAEDGGDFDGDVGDGGVGEVSEDGVETVLGFLLAENGLAEVVEIDAEALGGAGGEVGVERGGFAGEDDAGAVGAHAAGDGVHDEAREEETAEGGGAHEETVDWREVGGGAELFEETAPAAGGDGGVVATEDLVDHGEGEGLAVGVGHETAEFGGFGAFGAGLGGEGCGEQLGGAVGDLFSEVEVG